MKNKNISITICILVVISAFIFHFGIEHYKKKVTQEVMNYLIQQKGYQSTDIAEIKTYISKAPVVSTSVIFKDERNAMYMYKSDNGHDIEIRTKASILLARYFFFYSVMIKCLVF